MSLLSIAADFEELVNALCSGCEGTWGVAESVAEVLTMNSATGKRLPAFVRDGDYAHPGEEEAIHLLLEGIEANRSRCVLAAGCGSGGAAGWGERHGCGTVTGIEIDGETVALARARSPRVHIVEGDLCAAAALVSGPFDLICTMTPIPPGRAGRGPRIRGGGAGGAAPSR
jgi:SAM-dependent methyltransferase